MARFAPARLGLRDPLASNVAHDRVKKARIYARAGVPQYWLVDSDARTLEAFELQEGRWLQLGVWSADERARIAPFDAIEIVLADLFVTP